MTMNPEIPEDGPEAHGSDKRNLDTTYRVNGFRSLRDFSVSIRPGLNVLVGPNGSGKSNFLELLDFLENFLRHGATAAVSSAGGVGRVFGVETAKLNAPALEVSVDGLASFFHRERYKEHRVFRFKYRVLIKFNRKNSVVRICEERIAFSRLFSLENVPDNCDELTVVLVSRGSHFDATKNRIKTTGNTDVDDTESPLSVWRFSSEKPRDIGAELNVTLLGHDESVLSNRTRFGVFDAIRNALAVGRTFNVRPADVRQPDDLSRPPYISRDGSGLSATLYFLHKLSSTRTRPDILYLPKATPDAFDMIVDWARLVFPQLRDISVVPDPITGKYQGHLLVGNEPTLKIPFSAASDGTLKWLVYVCVVIAHGGMYSIEEPENFLHPRMQQFFIALIRDSLSSNSLKEKFIISTHSETLVNECRPEEIVIFEFVDGSSRAKRIDDPARIREEINVTGFGLGYFYANNAIS